MVQHQISHADHEPVAQRAIDAHTVSPQDRAELETLFYQRVSRSIKRAPQDQLREDVIHLNRPPLRTFVKLSDSLIDRCLSNGVMTERPVYEPLFGIDN